MPVPSGRSDAGHRSEQHEGPRARRSERVRHPREASRRHDSGRQAVYGSHREGEGHGAHVARGPVNHHSECIGLNLSITRVQALALTHMRT